MVDDHGGLIDVFPHQLVVMGRKDGLAAAFEKVLGHAVGNGTTVCKQILTRI